MTTTKSIEKFLPKEEQKPTEKPVQFEMDENLIKKLKAKLAKSKTKITLKDFYVAATKAYLDEKA